MCLQELPIEYRACTHGGRRRPPGKAHIGDRVADDSAKFRMPRNDGEVQFALVQAPFKRRTEIHEGFERQIGVLAVRMRNEVRQPAERGQLAYPKTTMADDTC